MLCERCGKDITAKKCSQCKQWKPLACYHKNKSHKDGLANICKYCVAELSKKNQKKRRSY